MRVLVIGAEGFVGAELCRELLARGHSIVASEIRPPGSRTRDLAGRIDWRIGDASRLEVMLHLVQPGTVDAIYFGAFYRPHVPGATVEQEVDVMGSGVWRAFEIARSSGVHRFVFPSSIAVHGPQSVSDPTFHEESPVRPYQLYGVLKLMGEYVGAQLNARIGRRLVTSLRIPSVYGPGAQIASRQVNVPAVQAARGARASVRYAPEARICIAHVRDTAHAVANILEADDVAHDVYELGGLDVSYGEIADAVRAVVPGAEVQFGRDATTPFPHRVDRQRGEREFGFTHRDLLSGMRSVVDHETARHDDSQAPAGAAR